MQARAGQNVAQVLRDRPDQAHQNGRDRDDHPDNEIFRGDEQRDAEHHEESIGESTGSVHKKPKPLTARSSRGFAIEAKEIPLDQPAPIPIGARAQVRHLDEVGKNIVSVKPEQRICIEDKSGNARGERDVIGQRAESGSARRSSRRAMQSRRWRANRHAGRADRCAMPLAAKGRHSRCVYIGQRHEYQEHDAELVHFSAQKLRGVTVTELMQHLEASETKHEHGQVFTYKKAAGCIMAQLRPVHTRRKNSSRDRREPNDRSRWTEPRPNQMRRAIQKCVRIPQAYPCSDRLPNRRKRILRSYLLCRLKTFRCIRRNIALKNVGGVQLGQETNDLILGGGVVS